MKNYIKKAIKSIRFYSCLVFTIALLFNSAPIKASHYVGAEIFYECTATPGIYRVTCKQYTNCNSSSICPGCPTGPLSSSCFATLSITGASGICNGTNFGSQSLVVVTSASALDVVQLCATSKSSCTNCGTRTPGSFTPGIEVYTFTGDINLNSLPSSCCMLSINFGSCCRSAEISTLSNPALLNYYFETIINRCVSPCNSSPAFNTPPVIAACAGQDFTYNLGVVDPDGDSLSYSLAASLTARGTDAPYVSPYSPSVPFPYLGAPIQSPPALPPLGINIDPSTGDLRFRPIGTFTAPLVLEVKQWKSIGGVPTLMGVTRRDLPFYSQTCAANNPPVLRTYNAGINLTSPQPKYAYSVCAGQQLCFYVTAWDNGALTDTTDLNWNAPDNMVSNGATFLKAYNAAIRSTVGPKFDSMLFCWTPPASMARSLPYYFVVTAKDRACPLPSRTSHSFSVSVNTIPLASITKVNKSCGVYDFGFSMLNSVAINPGNTQFQIETIPYSNIFITYNALSVTNYQFNKGGWHRIKLHLSSPLANGCTSDIIDSVLVPQPLKVTINDTASCLGLPLHLQAHGTGGTPFGTGYFYTFYTGGNNSSVVIRAFGTDSSVNIIPPSSNYAIYKVSIKDANGCSDSTLFRITFGSNRAHQLTPSLRLCPGTADSLNAGNNGGSVISWKWRKTPALPALTDSTSQKIRVSEAGTYIVQKSDATGCFSFDTAMVIINPIVSVNGGTNRSYCLNSGPLQLNANINGSVTDSFNWKKIPVNHSSLVLSYTAILTVTPTANTAYQVKGFISSGGVTCSSTDTVRINIRPILSIVKPAIMPVCSNTITVALPAVSSNKPGAITSIWSYTLNVQAINGNTLVVANLLNKPVTVGSEPKGNFIYVAVNDTDGCSAHDTLIVALFPVPVINAGASKSFCDYAPQFSITPATQLYAPNGGVLSTNELWFGNGIFKPSPTINAYSFNPGAANVKIDTNIITYRFNANYPSTNDIVFNPTVTGYTTLAPANGCMAQGTAIFTVIKTPVLRAGIASSVCKLVDSINLDVFMLNRSTTSVNPLSSYWYMGPPDQAYNSAIKRGRIFIPKLPPIESFTKEYVLVYADTSTTCRVADTSKIKVNENPVVSISMANPADSIVAVSRGAVYFSLWPVTASTSVGISLSSVPALPAAALNAGTGKFTLAGIPSGVYKITYHYTDSVTLCDNSASYTIRVVSTLSVAAQDQLNNVIQIYPNPNNGNFNLTAYITQQGNYEAQVMDITGNTIYSQAMNFKAGKNDLELRISAAPGIYFLKVTGKQSQMEKRFVIE